MALPESSAKNRLKSFTQKVGEAYHPRTMREKGLLWTIVLVFFTLLLATGILGWYWSIEPDTFNVEQAALKNAQTTNPNELANGYVYTSTLASVVETLLNKHGGYISNDVMPPGVLMDNMPNWEYGALVSVRDAATALRNHFSRSQSQSQEDADLSRAEPLFYFDNSSWALPTTEGEYRKGLRALRNYMNRLQKGNAPFSSRADNLRLYLDIVVKRLGSLSLRLNASAGQVQKLDLEQRKPLTEKTPWLQVDDVFYEARGYSWALLHMLRAVEIDFRDTLKNKNAEISMHQIVQALEDTQTSLLSPIVLNGNGFGLFANYSLIMANHISRANAAALDLADLLIRG